MVSSSSTSHELFDVRSVLSAKKPLEKSILENLGKGRGKLVKGKFFFVDRH